MASISAHGRRFIHMCMSQGLVDECKDIKIPDAAVLRNLEGSEQGAGRGTDVIGRCSM